MRWGVSARLSQRRQAGVVEGVEPGVPAFLAHRRTERDDLHLEPVADEHGKPAAHRRRHGGVSLHLLPGALKQPPSHGIFDRKVTHGKSCGERAALPDVVGHDARPFEKQNELERGRELRHGLLEFGGGNERDGRGRRCRWRRGRRLRPARAAPAGKQKKCEQRAERPKVARECCHE